MPRACSICGQNPEARQAIDEALRTGVHTRRVIADQWSVSKSALLRHESRHLLPTNGGPPRTQRTPKKDERLLVTLAETGLVMAACQAAGYGRSTVYQRRKDDEQFGEQWREAMEDAADRLEAEARRRAMEGTLKPVYYKGVLVGNIREYSDTLLIFLLKGARPEKYRERYDHTGPGGGPLEPDHVVVLPAKEDMQEIALSWRDRPPFETESSPRNMASLLPASR